MVEKMRSVSVNSRIKRFILSKRTRLGVVVSLQQLEANDGGRKETSDGLEALSVVHCRRICWR